MSALREPGFFEQYHLTRHFLGLDNGVVVAVQYKHTSSSLDIHTLRSAVLRVVQEEPALRLSVSNANTPHPTFVSCHVDTDTLLELVTFRKDVSWSDRPAFVSLIEEETGKRHPDHDSSTPLWRVVLCADNTVVFCFHHGIGDGKSGLAFHIMLLKALNASADADAPPSRAWVPAIETCTDVSPNWWTLLRELIGLFIPTSWTKLHSAWTGYDAPSIETSFVLATKQRPTSKPKVAIVELSSADVACFLQLSRKYNVTVTSALYAVIVSVYSRLILETQHPPSHITKLATIVPISLRPISGTPETAFCDHVSGWRNHVDLRPTFKWSHASEYASLLKGMSQKEAAAEVGLLRFLVGKYEGFNLGKLGKKRDSTFCLSNLGTFPKKHIGDVNGWQIGRTFFCSTDVVAGTTCNFDVVGHGDGGLTVSITRDPRSLDEEFARELVIRFETELRSIITNGSSS
jgi:hypothetical protein